jgi:ADP-ribose pyrophosphatase
MSAMKHDGGWLRRSSKYLFESPWFKLRQDRVTLPSGEPITYTVVDHPGYAVIVPLRSDGFILLERIYRYTVQETLLECPSGGLENEEERPEAAARRELLEETGWSAEKMSPLGSFFGSDGISNEQFHVFLATGLREQREPEREATEQMELEWMPFEEAAAMAATGRLRDAPTTLAILLADHALRQAGAETFEPGP